MLFHTSSVDEEPMGVYNKNKNIFLPAFTLLSAIGETFHRTF